MRKGLIASLFLNTLLIIGIVAGARQLVNVADRYTAEAAERWRTQFALLPERRHGIVFLGDSITEGGRWQEWLQNPAVLNRGIGGNQTADVLARLEQIHLLQPRQLFLMIGINDLNRRRSMTAIQADYRAILDDLAQHLPDTAVVVQSVLPVNDDLTFAPDNGDIVLLNDFLREEATRRGHVYVDLHAAFSDEDGRLRRELSNDGLHLLGAGYALWRDRIAALMREP